MTFKLLIFGYVFALTCVSAFARIAESGESYWNPGIIVHSIKGLKHSKSNFGLNDYNLDFLVLN